MISKEATVVYLNCWCEKYLVFLNLVRTVKIKNIMKASFKYILLLAFTILLFQGCDEVIDDIIADEPTSTTSLTVTGALAKSISHEIVEFQSSAFQEQKISNLDLYIGNIGTTETLVRVTLSDLDNGELFNSGTYNFVNDPNATFTLIAQYIDTDDNFYQINVANPGVNKLVITEVKNSLDNSIMKGEIELNLVNSDGSADEIKITGTFEAVGTAIQL